MKQAILTTLFLAALTSASPILETRQSCAPVHIIAARASTEDPGPGTLGSLIEAVIGDSSQTITTSSVDYPATLTEYASSSASGTAALKTLLTNQVTACPNQKIVLVGYSQGAHVIGDTLGGGGGGLTLGAKTPAISSSISSHVAAVILMGDPRHITGESFQKGTAFTQGLFPRLSDQSLEPFASKINSYCDFNDLFCASGSSTIVHLAYTLKYNNQAKEFILSKIGG